MRQLKAKILENKKAARDFYKMRVESSYLAGVSKPGQFVEVRCSEGTDPLLRRPLAVHSIAGSKVEMLYGIVGKGTTLLSRKVRGETVDIIGPLGNGFTVSGKTGKRENGKTILVAGGIGVAPLLSLAETLVHKIKNITVIIGACAKEDILCEKEFKKLGMDVKIATEDGSRGEKGLVTDLLKKERAEIRAIYACGPMGMLKAVATIARRSGISCQISLEERMACGVGVCLGCPVKVKSGGYKMVCKDGPVFDAEEIAW